MAYQHPQPSGPTGRRRIPFLVAGIGLACLILAVSAWAFLEGLSAQKSATKTNIVAHPTSHPAQTGQASPAQTQQSQNGISPLIFGTNLALFDSNDVVLRSAPTRSLLQQIHTRIIRMPIQADLSEDTEIQAAQAIKQIGVTPLVVLRGALDTNVLADDRHVINDMNMIFGSATVYYEYGNEEDLHHVSAADYATSWNAIIPQLKQLAPQANFIGPVTYRYDVDYLSTFLSNARPSPDQISWHEYTCNDNEAQDVCIAQIANWTTHIQDARSVMLRVLTKDLPIMITEWNYTSKVDPNDGKHRDAAFLSAWTSQALQALAANRVFASMQYSCTDTIPLIKNEALTAQGLTFQNVYQHMIVNGQQPSSVSATPFAG